MILPVGSALAQLQWSWFKTEQQLADMETFADATRGPFGSMILLSKMTQGRFWHFASIGAIITVLSLPLESVVIHALSVPMRGSRLPELEVNQNFIGVYRTNLYEWSLPVSHNASSGDRIPPPSITAAINLGIAQAASYGDWWGASMQTLAPNCSTGFCDYNHYQSLGIGHLCGDASPNVAIVDRQYLLPAGHGLETDLTLGLEDGLINTTVSFLYPDSSWSEDPSAVGPLVANVFILTSMLDQPIAIECALFWIVTHYESQTINGYWMEATIPPYMTDTEATSPARQAAIDPHRGQDTIMNAGDNCWINGTQRSTMEQASNPALKEGCAYTITALAQQGLQNWFKSPIHGLVGSLSPNLTASNNFITVLDALFREWRSDWPIRRWKGMSPQEFMLGNLNHTLFIPLTTALTSSIRTLPRGALFGQDTWGQLAEGIMYDSFRFRVLWPIMIFPTVLVVGAAAFAALVAVRARDHLWKKSSLPFVFFGLGRRAGEYVDMVEEAKGIRVRLEMIDGGVKLVEVAGSDVQVV
ncbi:hypothetical protein FKW77_001201 [Venturia effusa]|uniref:Uncharacterized protein n=1 Tax=Venturia effusa TaxID=50376 RepID=A0A517LNB4_9PEZI|nr:hypothetical protein FKW77_001201 [Venturia effusa]